LFLFFIFSIFIFMFISCGHDHAFEIEIENVQPTCTEDGYIIRKCNECEETEREDILALGHNMQKETIEPTCGEAGKVILKCTRCSYKEERAGAEPTGKHNLDEGVLEDATCTDPSTLTRTCLVCGKTIVTHPDDKLGHLYTVESETIVKEATCSTSGTKEIRKVCERCGKIDPNSNAKFIQIGVLGHDLKHESSYILNKKEATCTSDEEITYKCSRCDFTETETKEGSMKPHTPGGGPTCGADQVCTVCGTILASATGEHVISHTEEYYKETEEATCSEEAKKVYKCKNCDYTEYDIIPSTKKEHTKGPEATCGTDQVCTVCGEVIVPATGKHTKDGDAVRSVEATCISDGYKVYLCKVCKLEYNDDVVPKDPNAHTYDMDTIIGGVEVPASCIKPRYTLHKCIYCESTYENFLDDVYEPHKFVFSDSVGIITCTYCSSAFYDVSYIENTLEETNVSIDDGVSFDLILSAFTSGSPSIELTKLENEGHYTALSGVKLAVIELVPSRGNVSFEVKLNGEDYTTVTGRTYLDITRLNVTSIDVKSSCNANYSAYVRIYCIDPTK